MLGGVPQRLVALSLHSRKFTKSRSTPDVRDLECSYLFGGPTKEALQQLTALSLPGTYTSPLVAAPRTNVRVQGNEIHDFEALGEAMVASRLSALTTLNLAGTQCQLACTQLID